MSVTRYVLFILKLALVASLGAATLGCKLDQTIDGSLGSTVPEPPPPLHPKAEFEMVSARYRNVNAFTANLSHNLPDVTISASDFNIVNGTITSFNKTGINTYAVALRATTEGSVSATLNLNYVTPEGERLVNPTISFTYDITPPAQPNVTILVSPVSSTGTVKTPVIRVQRATFGDTVNLYTDAACTQLAGSSPALGLTVDVRANSLPADAEYNFYSQIVDPAGNASLCSTTYAVYTMATGESATPTATFPAGSNNGNVRILLSWVAAAEMAVFANSTCSGTANWQTYSTRLDTTVPNVAGSYPLSVLMRTTSGAPSACLTGTVIVDKSAPDAPSGFRLGKMPMSNTRTPKIYWDDQDDNGDSGIGGYEIRIVSPRGDGSEDLYQDWTRVPGPSGTSVDVILVSGATHKFYLRAYDNAGNYSAASPSNLNVFVPIVAADVPATQCPSGFVPVPVSTNDTSSVLRNANPFCVAKYEMTCDTGGANCRSVPEGPFYNTIADRHEAQSFCSAMGANYSLISLEQWQIVGGFIEQVGTNYATAPYTTHTVATGNINLAPILSASLIDDNDGCPTSPNGEYADDQCAVDVLGSTKRVHRMLNNQVIWDFSGNLEEVVSGGTMAATIQPNIANGLQETDISRLGTTGRQWFQSFYESLMGPTYSNLGYGYFRQTNPLCTSAPCDDIFRGYKGIYGMRSNPGATQRGFRCVYYDPANPP